MRRFILPVLLGAALLAPAAAHAAAPGINIGYVEQNRGLVDRAVQTHAAYARLFVSWSDFEPTGPKSDYSGSRLTDYDVAVDKLVRAGIKPIFAVVATPDWAHPGTSDVLAPPDNPADYANFLRNFATHFRGKVAAYEVWNEEDDASWWHPAPDVNRYVALLRAAYAALKQGDPSAVGLMGPLTGNDYDFLQAVYAAGGGGSFDAVSVHTDTACLDRGPDAFYRDPNGKLARYTFLGYRSVHDVMVANGDGAKPIWMTELGWTSTTSSCPRGMWAGQKPAGVSAADQATFLKMAYHCLAADPYVQVAAWFTLADDPAQPSEDLQHYGLLDAAGNPKPAWDAFTTVTTQGDTLSGPCGDFDPPALAIKSPTPNLKYVEGLKISGVATDPSGVSRVTFQADGKVIRNFGGTDVASGKTVSLTWLRSKNLSFGRHTITVIALDRNGNTVTRAINVVHVRHLPATLKTKIRLGKVRVGKGRRATLFGRVTKTGPLGLAGKVRIAWQQKRGKTWKTIHKGGAGARKPFHFAQRLKRPGTWRAVVTYVNVPPYKRSIATTKPFRVTH